MRPELSWARGTFRLESAGVLPHGSVRMFGKRRGAGSARARAKAGEATSARAPREPADDLIDRLAARVGSASRKDRIWVVSTAVIGNKCGDVCEWPPRGRLDISPRYPTLGLSATPDPLAPHWRVRLNILHPARERFGTLAHELGHVYCGHVGASRAGDWADRFRMHPLAREAEAELVCGVVSHVAGIVSTAPQRLESMLAERARQTGVPIFPDFSVVRTAAERICREAGLPAEDLARFKWPRAR